MSTCRIVRGPHRAADGSGAGRLVDGRAVERPQGPALHRRSRSRTPQPVTSTRASTTMRPDIFELPRSGPRRRSAPPRCDHHGRRPGTPSPPGSRSRRPAPPRGRSAGGTRPGRPGSPRWRRAPRGRAPARRTGCPTATGSGGATTNSGIEPARYVAGADGQVGTVLDGRDERRDRLRVVAEIGVHLDEDVGAGLGGHREAGPVGATQTALPLRRSTSTSPSSAPTRAAMSAVPSGLSSSTTSTWTSGAALRERRMASSMLSASL